MKPIAIFQFSSSNNPGHFAIYLRQMGRLFDLIRIDQGASMPENIESYAGICLLGGEMSVNDELPWIAPILNLIQQADISNIPVIGHCLGSQLLARALGAIVKRNPVKEIGWGKVEVADNLVAQRWMRDVLGQSLQALTVFQWHGDTFTLPAHAALLFSNEFCINQGFVIEREINPGRKMAHLGLQCHMEITADTVRQWAAAGHDEIAAEIAVTGGLATQQSAEMLVQLESRIAAQSLQAQVLYEQWLKGVHDD